MSFCINITTLEYVYDKENAQNLVFDLYWLNEIIR